MSNQPTSHTHICAFCDVDARIAALEAENLGARNLIKAQRERIADLEAENERLREAIQDFPSLIGDKSHEIPWEFYLAAYNRLKDAAKEDSDE